jgi:transposase-like protein
MDRAQNGSNSRERRHFSPQQKVAIVKEHLVDEVPISDLCDRHRIQPTQFYLWQKQLFENGADAFERKTKNAGPSSAERKIQSLEAKLVTKNESNPTTPVCVRQCLIVFTVHIWSRGFVVLEIPMT